MYHSSGAQRQRQGNHPPLPPLHAQPDPIAVGEAAADMAVTIQDGSTVTLSTLYSAGSGLVIFFYPKV